jgi:NitT/TauT family transport system permease protein
VAYSFIGVIAGEFILSTSGIGHEIAYAYDNFDNPRMYALILFVLAIVTTFNMLVWTWERRLARRRGMA